MAKKPAKAVLLNKKAAAKSKPKRQPARPDAVRPSQSAAIVLDRLWAVIVERRAADPAVSHSARLLSRGISKVAQKFGEEAVECLIEAVAGKPDLVVTESADVLYHLLVLWVASGVSPEAVWAELVRREGISGLAEKAARVPRPPPSRATRKIP